MMQIDYRCTDASCPECHISKEKWVKMGEAPRCDTCGGEMIRVWSGGTAIRTGDGYKGAR